MPPTAELLPTTVWEQAPYLGIMFIFMLFVLFWILKSRKEDQEFQAKQQKSTQDFQTKQQEFNREQQTEWQNFIREQDATWRAFSQEQRKENNCAMAEVNGTLKDVVTVSHALVSEVREMRADDHLVYQMLMDHDKQAKAILDLVKKPEPKPRTKASKPEIP